MNPINCEAAMITKRPDSPFYQIDVVVDGQRVRQTTRCRRRADAAQVAAKVVAEGAGRDRVRLGDAWARFEAAKIAEGRSETYMRHARMMIAKTMGTTVRSFWHVGAGAWLHAIDQGTLDRLRTERASEGAQPGTIAAELKILRAVLGHASRAGAKVGKVRSWDIPKEGQRIRYLTREEAERLVAELGGRTLAGDMVTVLLGTGLRWHELAGLTREMFDERRAVLRVVGKGRKAREVPVTGVAVLVLRDRLRMARGAAMGGGAGWLFPREDGAAHVSPPAEIARGIERAGLNAPEMARRFGRVTTHTLRHTYATWLRQAGMQLDDIQVLLGHSSVVQTLRYAKLDTDGLGKRVAAALDSI